ncbi:hypothetical protein TRFO_01534 [Tritrichomonas foetus]|uniref:Protein kinase domain-containing protein n=1 Tax=Tritrichomonas foetus TaxID=1144522 RepID=A0A1J4JXF1_9EUKA|nr:hypothetical protein TRFO_01534 [Tritrichomonas foetus]|eukprot:OHT03831.1 hypothetical protein TRFO_01534 [Tritrichomonas foetus]
MQSKVFDLEQIVKKLVPLEEILNSKEARRDNLYDHEIKTLKNNNYVLRNEVKKLLAIIKNKDPAEYQKLNDYYNDSELDLNRMDTFSDIFVPEIDEYNNSDQHENELKIQDDDEKIYKSNLRKDNLYSTFKFYDDCISCDVVQKVLNKSNKDILNNSDAIKSSFSQRNINYQHPYLATIIAMGPTSSVDVYYTKYYPRTLKDALRLNLFDHTRLSAIIGQIISGLTFLESKGIYHQSIKASNILLTDQHNVKIADYYTRITDFDLFTLGKKRLKHYPIEFVVKHDFGKRFDIYMFGLLLFKIVSGNTKIDYSASDILFGTKLQLPNTYSLNVKSWVIQLIENCIGDPMRRPTFLDIHHLAIKENFCFFDNTDEYIMKAIIPIM